MKKTKIFRVCLVIVFENVILFSKTKNQENTFDNQKLVFIFYY